MGLHSLTEYVKYRWKAKGRHGTHSPFVYALVENVLQADRKEKHYVGKGFNDNRYGALLTAIAAYYSYTAILDLNAEPQNGTVISNIELDVVILEKDHPENWVEKLPLYTPVAENGGMIVAPGIHHSSLHTHCWGKLRTNPSIKLTIDLFEMGLLFSGAAFKEKQHFILKC